ncbi:MAG: hypothetical protein J6Y28_08725 [Acholeplasmatales bacterium]|nr:hypothetical protein [Acholeplasmatales bacterium]
MMYNKEKSKKTKEFISNSKNGIAVVILSLISMFLVPLLGSYLTGTTQFPETIPEWILYFACALAISVCCLFIFLALFNQGKMNVKEEPEYIQAKELHLKNFKRMNGQEIIPIDPFKWEKQQKTRKGIYQTIGMFCGLLGFGLAVIHWNNSQFISATLSVIMSIAFGLVKMADVERMWTEGWLEFELYVEKKLDMQEAEEKAQNKPIMEPTEVSDAVA